MNILANTIPLIASALFMGGQGLVHQSIQIQNQSRSFDIAGGEQARPLIGMMQAQDRLVWRIRQLKAEAIVTDPGLRQSAFGFADIKRMKHRSRGVAQSHAKLAGMGCCHQRRHRQT